MWHLKLHLTLIHYLRSDSNACNLTYGQAMCLHWTICIVTPFGSAIGTCLGLLSK